MIMLMVILSFRKLYRNNISLIFVHLLFQNIHFQHNLLPFPWK